MELLHGSPTHAQRRQERELRCYAFLDRLGVVFDRCDHPECPASSMEICAQIDAVLQVRICKNLFLCNRQQTAFYLLLMPPDKPFRTKELSAQLGSSRLSFATQAHMQALLDLEPGSVSVLGLMNDTGHRVRLVIDEELLQAPYFGCHPCVNTSTLRFSTEDLLHTVLPALGRQPELVRLGDPFAL